MHSHIYEDGTNFITEQETPPDNAQEDANSNIIWDLQSRREFFDEIVERRGLDPLYAHSWYSEEILQEINRKASCDICCGVNIYFRFREMLS